MQAARSSLIRDVASWPALGVTQMTSHPWQHAQPALKDDSAPGHTSQGLQHSALASHDADADKRTAWSSEWLTSTWTGLWSQDALANPCCVNHLAACVLEEMPRSWLKRDFVRKRAQHYLPQFSPLRLTHTLKDYADEPSVEIIKQRLDPTCTRSLCQERESRAFLSGSPGRTSHALTSRASRRSITGRSWKCRANDASLLVSVLRAVTCVGLCISIQLGKAGFMQAHSEFVETLWRFCFHMSMLLCKHAQPC